MKEIIHKITSHKIVKHTKKVLYIKLLILSLLLLPFVVFTFYTTNTTLIEGIRSFVVLTGSMTPTIPQGSITYTQEQNTYQKGDIITFSNASGQTVTHRVAEVTKIDNQTAYITKGDANDTNDSTPVAGKDVIGKVAFHIPYIGNVIQFLKTPKGFLSIVIFPTLLFVGFELWNIKKEIEKSVEKRVMEKMKAQTV